MTLRQVIQVVDKQCVHNHNGDDNDDFYVGLDGLDKTKQKKQTNKKKKWTGVVESRWKMKMVSFKRHTSYKCIWSYSCRFYVIGNKK